jgi:hypothetical protein
LRFKAGIGAQRQRDGFGQSLGAGDSRETWGANKNQYAETEQNLRACHCYVLVPIDSTNLEAMPNQSVIGYMSIHITLSWGWLQRKVALRLKAPAKWQCSLALMP